MNAFYRLIAGTDPPGLAMDELERSDWYQRLKYELWFNEPYAHGVLRRFGQALAVAAFAAATRCPDCLGERHAGAPPKECLFTYALRRAYPEDRIARLALPTD